MRRVAEASLNDALGEGAATATPQDTDAKRPSPEISLTPVLPHAVHLLLSSRHSARGNGLVLRGGNQYFNASRRRCHHCSSNALTASGLPPATSASAPCRTTTRSSDGIT